MKLLNNRWRKITRHMLTIKNIMVEMNLIEEGEKKIPNHIIHIPLFLNNNIFFYFRFAINTLNTIFTFLQFNFFRKFCNTFLIGFYFILFAFEFKSYFFTFKWFSISLYKFNWTFRLCLKLSWWYVLYLINCELLYCCINFRVILIPHI